MLQHKSTIGIIFSPYTQVITMRVFQFLLVLLLHNLSTTEATCQARCEQTKGRTTDTGLTNRALVGHSFKNFTVNKPFECLRLCFVEKCRCQAYDMSREYQKAVINISVDVSILSILMLIEWSNLGSSVLIATHFNNDNYWSPSLPVFHQWRQTIEFRNM